MDQKEIEIQSLQHHMKAEAAYKTLSSDCKAAAANKAYIVLCVDLQQVLSCPNLHHSSMYYQRQLATYNFAIHNAGSGVATMNIWPEIIGKRGSAEVASCIFKYIISNFQVLSPGELRSLVVWSDRCVGENNNWKMISLYNYLIRAGYFTSIEQKFLVSGHSFLPCDRDFALNEKKRRVMKVTVPSDWKYVIGEACQERPFIITEIQQEDILDFSAIENEIKETRPLKLPKPCG